MNKASCWLSQPLNRASDITELDQLAPSRTKPRREAGSLRSTDISVLFPENEGTKDFAHEKHTKAPEGTATGATSGAVIGGGLGWLAGIGALARHLIEYCSEREEVRTTI
jgi:hypothetical protein